MADRSPLLLVLFAATLFPAAARALKAGEPAPEVIVEDTSGNRVPLPAGKNTLLFYEDKDAGAQNARARDVVGPITDLPENRARLLFFAVADLGSWNWQPARAFALKEIAGIEKKEATVIYCDWSARMRKAWRLTKGKSGVILIDAKGVVRFFGEGTLSTEQTDDLVRQLSSIGVKTSPGHD